jgi:hypothetical protein
MDNQLAESEEFSSVQELEVNGDSSARAALAATITGACGTIILLTLAVPHSRVYLSAFEAPFGLIISLSMFIFMAWGFAVNILVVLGPSYDLLIRPQGLNVRPSITKNLIEWDNISASRVVSRDFGRYGGQKSVIELDLTRRIFCLANPFGLRTIAIAAPPACSRQIKEAGQLIRQYRIAAGWRK